MGCVRHALEEDHYSTADVRWYSPRTALVEGTPVATQHENSPSSAEAERSVMPSAKRQRLVLASPGLARSQPYGWTRAHPPRAPCLLPAGWAFQDARAAWGLVLHERAACPWLMHHGSPPATLAEIGECSGVVECDHAGGDALTQAPKLQRRDGTALRFAKISRPERRSRSIQCACMHTCSSSTPTMSLIWELSQPPASEPSRHGRDSICASQPVLLCHKSRADC